MFFSRPKETKNILVFDIGSSSVNSFLVRSSKDAGPELLANTRVTLPLLDNLDLEHLERHTRKAVREISEHFRKDFSKTPPDLIFAVISAPWYFCETKIVKLARREPFIISEELVSSLVADELELFKPRAQEKFSMLAEEIEILESEAMRFTVNGYHLKSPFGKKTTQLELALYASAARKNFLSTLREIWRHFFGEISVEVGSEPLALFRVLSEMVNPQEGFVLVDVGGEITEVYLVRGGVLENVIAFNWGGNLMIRRLASLLKVDLGEALSIFKTKVRGELNPALDEKIVPALKGVCSQWQGFLAESLSGLGKNEPLPQTLLLLGGAAGSEALKSCATAQELASFTILGKPFNVLTFIPENLEGRIQVRGLDRKDPQMTLPLLLVLSASNYAWKK